MAALESYRLTKCSVALAVADIKIQMCEDLWRLFLVNFKVTVANGQVAQEENAISWRSLQFNKRMLKFPLSSIKLLCLGVTAFTSSQGVSSVPVQIKSEITNTLSCLSYS